jgi:cytidyltransferase-like protein
VTSDFSVASVHGRFQPVHKGHVEYLLAAMEKCDFVYVGLTQLVRSRLVDISTTAHHRAELASNPLTFFERHGLVREALLENGVSRDRFEVLPFPIEDDRALAEFLPISVPVLTTVYDDWNREKIRRLKAAGYHVEILWERSTKDYVGSTVRQLITENNPRYQEMVPIATVRLVERLDLGGRLRALSHNVS